MNQSDRYATGSQSGYSANGTQTPATPNMYANRMNPYSYYGQQSGQVYSQMSLLDASNYYFNPWSFPQSQGPPLFNPGQPPPPLPAEVMKPPPPPPEPGFKTGGRGRYRSVYPRGNTVRGGTKRPRFQPGTYTKNNTGLSTNQSEPEVYDSDQSADNNVQVHRKSKRKPMSARYTRQKREWCRDDAVKALALEEEYHQQSRAPMLILKFPDPEISSRIVRTYSPDIETVHFQQPSTARYCFVQLKVGADVDEVRKQISQIEFGTGKIIAEHKMPNYENQQTQPEEIDPYTLYIGNLPTSISVAFVKETFNTAKYIDIGYAQRMKYTRYAFIRYDQVEDAMDAYRKSYNLLINARSLIVRFRRQKGNVGMPGESKVPNPPVKTTKINHPSRLKASTPNKDDREDPMQKTGSDVDSKANVIAEASLMMKNAHDDDPDVIEVRSDSNNGTTRCGPIVTIKHENGEVEVEDAEVEEPHSMLLGTRIKNEPNDALVLGTSNDNAPDDDDELPLDDEDEIIDRQFEESYTEEDDDDSDIYSHHHWERIRLEELARKEAKPDISLLPPLNIRSVNQVPEVRLEENYGNEKNDLDDLFKSMNPDDDDDF